MLDGKKLALTDPIGNVRDMRKVGIDLGPASRTESAPGTARFVEEQARALLGMSVDWEWVVVADGPRNPALSAVSSEVLYAPRRSQWVRNTWDVGRIWQRSGCDLGFATAYFVPWSGVPVVANFFDSGVFNPTYQKSWNTTGRGSQFAVNRLLSWYAARRARRLFTLSEYCRQEILQAMPGIDPKVVVVPCGIKPPVTLAQPAPAWSQEFQRPYFLYVGVFSDNKNQYRLLDAWSALAERDPQFPSLVLTGPFSPDYVRQKLSPGVERWQASGRLKLTGRVSDGELAWLYQNAMAYVQPSIMEGFGMPLLEAMSYGLPVTCSNTTSFPEAAGDAALYFDPESVASIREALLRMADDPALRQQLIGLGSLRWSQFTWQSNARLVAAEIDLVLKQIQDTP